MNCPVCGKEMEKGGLIADGAILVSWHPEREYNKKGLKSFLYREGKTIGEGHILRKLVKIPNAWYCHCCNKITGIFDVTMEAEV